MHSHANKSNSIRFQKKILQKNICGITNEIYKNIKLTLYCIVQQKKKKSRNVNEILLEETSEINFNWHKQYYPERVIVDGRAY